MEIPKPEEPGLIGYH